MGFAQGQRQYTFFTGHRRGRADRKTFHDDLVSQGGADWAEPGTSIP
jgi:hypothetical protein